MPIPKIHTLTISDGTSITYTDVFLQKPGNIPTRVITKANDISFILKSGTKHDKDTNQDFSGTWISFLPTSPMKKDVFIHDDINMIAISDVLALSK